MLNFLPVLLILLAIIGLAFLRRSRMPIGTIWLMMAVITLLIWAVLLILRTHLPQALVISTWFPLSVNSDLFSLGITENTWLLLFAFASLLVGTIFASSAHLSDVSVFTNWNEVLFLTAMGMLSLLADSPLAFLIMWAMIDIVEIVIFTIVNRDQHIGVQTYAIFLGRALGLVLVILAMALSYQYETPLVLSEANGSILSLLIAGAGLRLGVLPVHLPYTRDLEHRRSMGTVLRMLAPLSVFSFLSKLASPQTITGVNLLIFILAVASSLIGAINWFSAKNELEGRPYWLLSFSGFALLSFFRGQHPGVLVWGVLMMVIGGWAFLSESHSRKIDFLLPFVLLTISGIPFTPSAIGFTGIASDPLQVLNPFLWVSLAFLMAGMVKFSLSGGDSQVPYENWMKLFYSIGMGLLAISPWAILLFKTKGWNQIQSLWGAVFELLVFATIILVNYFKPVRSKLQNSSVNNFYKQLVPFGKKINQIFHFDWIYQILAFFLRIQSKIVYGFTLVLEGEGGILWALVFLALLVSLLVNGGAGL